MRATPGPAPARLATQSWWLSHLDPADVPLPAAAPPETCDVAIVGAGMTGCATAYWLRELSSGTSRISGTTPTDRAAAVVVLDARGCAGGATGRNGGHLWPKPSSEFERDTVSEMVEFLDAHGVDCDLTRDGAVALDRRAPEYGVEYHDGPGKADDCGSDSESNDEEWEGWADEWDGAACRAQLQTDAFSAGYCYPDACQLYPAKVAAAFLSRSGCTYCAPVRVTSIDAERGDDGQGWQALRWFHRDEADGNVSGTDDSGGVLRARRVVVAANAWAGDLLPELAPHLTPLRNNVVMTRPLLRTSAWGAGAFSVDSEVGARELYGIRRPDGRVCLGGAAALEDGAARGVSDDTSTSEVVGRYLRRFLRERFPSLFLESEERVGGERGASSEGGGRSGGGDDGSDAGHGDPLVEAEWSGIIALTTDGKPLVGPLPTRPHIYVGVGFNGNGMPQCTGAAKGLALMLEGRGDEAHPFLRGDANVGRLFK